MATTPENTEKMSFDECRQNILEQIYVPVLLEKCAAAGIRATTDLPAQQLIEMAGALRKVKNLDQIFTAVWDRGLDKLCDDASLSKFCAEQLVEDKTGRKINPTMSSAVRGHQASLSSDKDRRDGEAP